ncbi:TPD52 [Bugula neritina]|uniref:TPD52 n=1 Tax=Bugula neritina TaxID=10212 RepID=A0A7J7KGP7_BUGNE|nr:TPD52 [Bugula neritina]
MESAESPSQPEVSMNSGNAEEAVRPELTSEEKEAKENEWREELIKTEEEVNTLKQVLASKQKRVTDLRRLVMKANTALKTAGEKTSAAFSTVGKKLEDVKNSEFVKSFEEKVGHAYDSVKAKVGGNKPAAAATEVPPTESGEGAGAESTQ